MASSTSPKARNLIGLDGGGIRGLVQLIILDNIMETIKSRYNLDATPSPCQYFDLIGGTSTGGYNPTCPSYLIASDRTLRLNALLLGRLRMSTKEALGFYASFAKAVFGTPKPNFGWVRGGAHTRYSATVIEREIKKIIVEKSGSADEPMLDLRDQNCKT